MKEEYQAKPDKMALNYFMNPKNWWQPLTFILIISLIGVGMIGYQTYNDAPPMAGFKTSEGKVLYPSEQLHTLTIASKHWIYSSLNKFIGR